MDAVFGRGLFVLYRNDYPGVLFINTEFILVAFGTEVFYMLFGFHGIKKSHSWQIVGACPNDVRVFKICKHMHKQCLKH